jgi:hypothetical protein
VVRVAVRVAVRVVVQAVVRVAVLVAVLAVVRVAARVVAPAVVRVAVRVAVRVVDRVAVLAVVLARLIPAPLALVPARLVPAPARLVPAPARLVPAPARLVPALAPLVRSLNCLVVLRMPWICLRSSDLARKRVPFRMLACRTPGTPCLRMLFSAINPRRFKRFNSMTSNVPRFNLGKCCLFRLPRAASNSSRVKRLPKPPRVGLRLAICLIWHLFRAVGRWSLRFPALQKVVMRLEFRPPPHSSGFKHNSNPVFHAPGRVAPALLVPLNLALRGRPG